METSRGEVEPGQGPREPHGAQLGGWPSLGLLVALIALPGAALAADFQAGDSVVVPADERIVDDVYAAGGEVLVRGEIDGDLIVAGGEVTSLGPITGDLLVAGGQLTVKGPVAGTIRATGGRIVVSGTVGEDLVLLGGELTLTQEGAVGRDVLAMGGLISLRGDVDRDVRVSGGELTLAGRVGGKVEARVEELTIADGAVIEGPVTYSSEQEAEVAEGAEVGQLVHEPRSEESTLGFGSWLLSWLQAVVGLVALAFAMRFVLPGLTARSVEALARPGRAVLLGLAAAFVGPLLLMVIAVVTSLLGVWWIALVAVGLWIFFGVMGLGVVAMWLGARAAARAGRDALSPHVTLLLGAALLGTLMVLPWIGWPLTLIAMLFGAGALLDGAWSVRRSSAASSPTLA